MLPSRVTITSKFSFKNRSWLCEMTLYKGLDSLIWCSTMVGINNKRSVELQLLTDNSCALHGITSPSFVYRLIIRYIRTYAWIIWDFLKSPTRHIRHRTPSRGEITACRENVSVSVLFLGRESFANTTPPMKLSKNTLKLHCIIRTTTTILHSSVIYLKP